jgi:hypothetical protein
MGKVLKPLLLVAAVAINVIPGVGQALSTVAFSALGTGFVSAGVAAAVGTGLTLAASAGLAAAAGAFNRGKALSTSSLSRLALSFSADTPRKIVFGETAMNTDMLYQEASGTDQEFIDVIIAAAAHKVDAFTEIYSEDKLMWSAAGGITATYTGYLTVDLVTEGTRTNGIPINGGTIWNADCTLTGCAYLKLRVKRTGASSKADSPFAAGIPSRMTIVGRGMPVYDPRRDSTAGGSGPHRANNQATWQYADGGTPLGNNPALQALTFLLGWKVGGVLSVGAGLPVARLAMADWIAAANVCDEIVTLPGGSQRRYETHGVFSDDDAPAAVVDALCRHMNANLRDTGGRIGIRMAINDTGGSLVEFTEDDLQGGYDWQPCAALQDSYNVVRGKWTDPSTASLYQMPPYPAQSVASPDGIDRPLPLDLPMVQNAGRAQMIAQQVLKRGQVKGTFTADFGPRAWACEVGQPVRLTLPAIGAASKLFRVVSQELKVIGVDADAQAVCPMTLIEEDPGIYAITSGDITAVPAAVAAVSYLPSSQPFLLGDLADVNAAQGTKLAGISTGADVTADVLPVLTLPAAPVIRADFTGAVLAGQLPRDVKATRTRGGTNVSSSTTWGITATGCTATIGSDGTITITACASTGRIVVTSDHLGVDIGGEFAVVKENGAPPASGGAGATSASDSSIASITGNTYGGEQAGPLTVTAGSGGTVTLSAPLSFSSAAAVSTRGKWRWRIVGGSYADVATEISSTSAAIANEPDTGYIEVSQTQTGLTPGSAYEFILQLRRASGSGTVDFSGTASAVAS